MDNIIQKAENAIKKIKDDRGRIRLSTSQIRKFLAGVNKINNKLLVYEAGNMESKSLPQDIVADIDYLKIRLVYQAGKERDVKMFISTAEILKYLDDIGNSITKFKEFYKYSEALVAYHRYHGGR